MQFERDIFISYAHIDNQSLEEAQEGWISLLHRGLEIRLAQLRGEKPDIWRDLKLQGNDDFGDTILDQFPKLALLVSILSPRYVKSPWCRRELEHFCQEAERRGGIKVGDNKARIFKVIKTYLPHENHPSELSRLLGYEFFEFDSSGRPREFSKLFGAESERKFWAKLEDLAYDIHQTLELLEALPETGEVAAAPAAEAVGKTIYLAETTFDLNEARDQIRRELELAGHRVLPEAALPLTPDFAQLVRQNLARSDLSVHLVAPQAAITESPSEAALQQLLSARAQEQIDLAAACCSERATPQLIWTPSAAVVDSDPWLQPLQNQPDFVRTNLESFKTLIKDRLSPKEESLTAADGDLLLYLDYDQSDSDSPVLDSLCSWLQQQRFEVIPSNEQAGDVARSEHLLKQCRAVLIFYERAARTWLQRRVRALQKTRQYGRAQPLQAQAVYVAGAASSTLQAVVGAEVPMIEGGGEFQPTRLAEFIAQVQG